MELVQNIMIFVGLGINSFWDLKTKHISLWITAIWGIEGILYHVCQKTICWQSLYSFIPGVLCFALAKVTREAVGFGDAWILLALGCWMQVSVVFMIIMMAMGITGVVALFMIVVMQKSKKTEIPFVPFLWAGYILFSVMGG